MKEIEAIIQPHMFTKVMESLHAMPHFPGVTVSKCRGQGRGRGTGGSYVALEETIDLVDMVELKVFCSNAICDEIVEVIQTAAHTGNPGDGVIMVTDLSRVIRIRSGQEQDEAV